MEFRTRGYYTIGKKARRLVEGAVCSSQGIGATMFIGDLRLAYLDPGTGSLIIQGLIAVTAGAAVTIRLYWKRFKRFFGAGQEDGEDVEARPDPSVDG